ncbi:DNA repair protein rad50 [Steccherinum ochraceum]|uniref:DNA repair protein RAD50 n=1 Tax=Steccherinum ochraceum TaxID=92696 RepID=A0A4R0RSF4_9APHY|nr:DNA repair protein rad50 [Steccherinum ochraceum]
MASLNKLAVRGIRSFDDKQIAVIEFFNPVTVIVGHNGSGKTTIIECLKYATTGDQPPNTRGGAFIHDPKMANEKEVKAQVKLRFNAANGQRMLAVRNLSVTVKKGGAMTMKTLESILALDDDNQKAGKRAAISTKCAEMDVEIPNLLGVSKAVLENVIFCHQEDSYWPLSEPSTLKKKFDEIFEATKYTKALDSIKSLRKDRMADLKAEKERLDSLVREKTHADKLKSRMTTLQSDISSKELEHEETKEEYERLVAANQKFYDSATKFRETYTRVETLEKTKTRYEADLADARENLQELQGTDEELGARQKNFDNHIGEQRRKKQVEENRQQDLEDELAKSRKAHVNEMSEQGRLQAQQKLHEQLLADREELIRNISSQHHLTGYDHSPLGRDEILEFINKLSDLQESQNRETERLQSEGKRVNDEFNIKLRQLTGTLEKHRQNKEVLRQNTTSLQGKVAQEEEKAEDLQNVPTHLRKVQDDISDLEKRIETSRGFITTQKWDEKLSQKQAKARDLERTRDELTTEMRSLTAQADSRARLDVSRTSLQIKSKEVDSKVKTSSNKFLELVGSALDVETMERMIDKAIREKERAVADLENAAGDANQEVKSAQANILSLTQEVETKTTSSQTLKRQIQRDLDEYTFPEDMSARERSVAYVVKDAPLQLAASQKSLAEMSQGVDVWEGFLKDAKTKQCCPLCTQSMNAQILSKFENMISEKLKKVSSKARTESEDEVDEWHRWVTQSQKLAADEKERIELVDTVIPGLEKKLEGERARLSDLRTVADKAISKVDESRGKLKDLTKLKQEASMITRIREEIENLKRDVTSLEGDLAASGSTKTADEVQEQLEKVSSELRTIEKDRSAILTEKERLNTQLRLKQDDLMNARVKESDLKRQMHEKQTAEQQVQDMREQIERNASQTKELDAHIAEAQAPIRQLEQAHQQEEKEWNDKISVAQQASQALNMSVDKLEGMNKRVERQAKEKVSKQLERCNERIRDHEAKISSLNSDVESARSIVQGFEKEISDAGAALANLRENIRVRKLIKDIAATVAEIAMYDMEEAAKAKRIFQEKYSIEKEKETHMQSKYAHIGGELSSAQAQLKTLESDMKEFKNIQQKYRDQLVKVKLSDMANNDLEKYAKALDSAIMKYHGLKMEEVNDTMRHLWNKTYQGTDIDGIKISSDSEGGATKRSYNYRVVMTKDNVEMDMRGRCSAGQKMLASIIIRLALADSFGQNCGILALDEPTNALDTENIDALAESLIDIINERKSQGHFQLVIITHDENFLRKLGQNDVMEYYWRVSRDARQKSVIERHRFS